MPTQNIHPTLSQLAFLDSFPNEIEGIQGSLAEINRILALQSSDNRVGIKTLLKILSS